MDDSATGNAMTEIALALAMAFFSIMVLTMVSMGAGESQPQPHKAPAIEAVGAVLTPPKESSQNAGQIEVASQDMLIIYHSGRFLDSRLAPVDLTNLPNEGRILLALPPNLALTQALDVRAQVQADNLIVSTLDDQWLKALRNWSHENR